MPNVINPVDLGYELPLNSITYVVYGIEGETVLYNNDQTIPDELIQYFECLETGCTDQLACNYDPEANAGNPEEECNYPDECGECEGEETGPGAIYDCGCDPLPFPDACDCEGNSPIDLFQCDCEGTPDLDQDGICDDIDDCVGYIDECGVCNGPGAIYDCGCFDIADGDCDCLGNVLDACGICGGTGTDVDGDGICDDVDPCIGVYDNCGVCNGDNSTCSGCMDPEADNYDPTAWFDDGSCIYCQTNIWIPNTVTPNNDGINDVWRIVTDYPDCWRTWETRIYNRWGQLVWYSEDITEPWIVNVQGGQYYASDGVYVYLVRGVTWELTDFVWDKTGHITVFR
jgi:gliding motility-associated-like protein